MSRAHYIYIHINGEIIPLVMTQFSIFVDVCVSTTPFSMPPPPPSGHAFELKCFQAYFRIDNNDIENNIIINSNYNNNHHIRVGIYEMLQVKPTACRLVRSFNNTVSLRQNFAFIGQHMCFRGFTSRLSYICHKIAIVRQLIQS